MLHRTKLVEANLIRAHSVQELSDVRVYLFKMMDMYLREGGRDGERKKRETEPIQNK